MFSQNKHLSALSSESQGWLLACLDPYHDYQYEVDGLPDQRTAPSVVQVHNQSYTVTAPASAAGGTYDCSVMYTGFNSEIGLLVPPGLMTATATSAIHPYDHASLSAGQAFGALTIWAGASGTTMVTGAPVTINELNVSLGSVKATDRCRLIGVAFEIHNTTAEIYRQGSLTVAQLADPVSDMRTVMYQDTNATTYTPVFVQADQGPVRASTLAPLLAVPGSNTWPAAEGVYAVPRMTRVPVELMSAGLQANVRTPIIYGTDGKSATIEPAGFTNFASGGTNRAINMDPVSPSGFSPLQVFLSGLSNQTTLTVTFRTIVEYFPAPGSSLLPLAEPSPNYDPLVFGAYSAIIKEAPYAVPVHQNAAGDYFRKILKVVSTALDLTSPMFGSYAPLVAIAAKGGHLLSSLGQGPAKASDRKIDKRAAGPPALQTRRR